MNESDRRVASESASQAILDLIGSLEPGDIGTYLASDGELDPLPLKELLEPLGWRFHLPAVGPANTMTFRRWNSETWFGLNQFGILEPDQDAAEIGPRDLDFVLVPCVAVDPAGNRVGMGAGYYDRAFAPPVIEPAESASPQKAERVEKGPELIAMVFELQVQSQIPSNPWDVPVDVIVTESRTLHARPTGPQPDG